MSYVGPCKMFLKPGKSCLEFTWTYCSLNAKVAHLKIAHLEVILQLNPKI